MNKKKKNIVIFPCSDNKIMVKHHYYVVSYFLSRYLEKYFNVVRIANKDKNKKYMEKPHSNSYFGAPDSFFKDVDYILTTHQRGFTKFMQRNKKMAARLNRIRRKYPKIKIVSIHDHSAFMDYYEDILLVATPFEQHKADAIFKNSKTEVVYTGWCADHKIFKDNPKKNGDLNIVLDHAALQDFRFDATSIYLKHAKALKAKYPDKLINLCRINKGFEFYDFEKKAWTFNLENRWWTSKYDDDFENGNGCHVFQIAECLNNSHIFCITHVESCGLTGIEALMAGCRLYNPSGKDRFNVRKNNASTREQVASGVRPDTREHDGPFIKEGLLHDYMDYEIFEIDNDEKCFEMMERDMMSDKNGSKISTRRSLIRRNSWKFAAGSFYNAVKDKDGK